MTNIIRKVGHIIKHSPEIIRRNVIISKLQHQNTYKKITVNKKRKPQIIVSLTSYKKRFATLDICLKSIFNQTLLPDRLILYLSKDEDINDLPVSVRKLQNYGLEIKFVEYDLKPHKKYYYAMQEFPNDIVITIDDDIIYDKDLIKDLYETYKKFPDCVIAARAHEIKFNSKKLARYSDWTFCSTKSEKPSFLFLATEGAGTLYPPHLLNLNMLLNLKYINKYINVDDLWVKVVELFSNVPVVITNPDLEKKRIEIPEAQAVGLARKNLDENQNDMYLNEMEKDFQIVSKLKKKQKLLDQHEILVDPKNK